jgi:hypothetical protein
MISGYSLRLTLQRLMIIRKSLEDLCVHFINTDNTALFFLSVRFGCHFPLLNYINQRKLLIGLILLMLGNSCISLLNWRNLFILVLFQVPLEHRRFFNVLGLIQLFVYRWIIAIVLIDILIINLKNFKLFLSNRHIESHSLSVQLFLLLFKSLRMQFHKASMSSFHLLSCN